MQRKLIEAQDDAKTAMKAKEDALLQLEVVRDINARQNKEIEELMEMSDNFRRELQQGKEALSQAIAVKNEMASEMKVGFYSSVCLIE